MAALSSLLACLPVLPLRLFPDCGLLQGFDADWRKLAYRSRLVRFGRDVGPWDDIFSCMRQLISHCLACRNQSIVRLVRYFALLPTVKLDLDALLQEGLAAAAQVRAWQFLSCKHC